MGSSFNMFQVFANMFGFFSKEEFELSAPVEGRLLYEEQPVAGKKVFRKLNYGDDYIDEVTTGTDGRFSFPEKVIKMASYYHSKKPRFPNPCSSPEEEETMKGVGVRLFTFWAATLGFSSSSLSSSDELSSSSSSESELELESEDSSSSEEEEDSSLTCFLEAFLDAFLVPLTAGATGAAGAAAFFLSAFLLAAEAVAAAGAAAEDDFLPILIVF